jgi:AcrR family transcriptional regulator
MPKRDLAYMQGQREAIARAALKVLLEKGIYGTSLRDICEAAGISMGALYVHFATKDEAVLAAFALDNHERRFRRRMPLPESRAEFLDQVREGFRLMFDDPVELRRSRLSLQFVADMALAGKNPPGLADIYRHHRQETREDLEHLVAKGEVTLPLGLERTVDAHLRAAMGTTYMLMGNKDLDFDEVVETTVALIDLTFAEPKPKA